MLFFHELCTSMWMFFIDSFFTVCSWDDITLNVILLKKGIPTLKEKFYNNKKVSYLVTLSFLLSFFLQNFKYCYCENNIHTYKLKLQYIRLF